LIGSAARLALIPKLTLRG